MSATQASFYVTGGTLRADAPSYVRRRADEELYEGLRAGRFCYVLTPRQMGKSSLMLRTAERLRDDGVAVVRLDLTEFGQNLTAEQWYYGLLDRVGKQLNLEAELEEFWSGHERLGLLQRWMLALREVVLMRVPAPLVIFVDEIEYVRSLPFSTDEFFAAIREFYNRRTEDPELERLTVCLLGVASPSNLIRDTRTTPYNIGTRIELTDFSEAEAAPLTGGLRRDEATSKRLLKRVLYWTCGHPYLTQRLCLAVSEDAGVKNEGGVDRKCEELFLSSRARDRDVSLLDVRQRILRSEEADRADLLELYRKVRAGGRVPDDETNPFVSVLRLSGITRSEKGLLRVRNRIYHRAFDKSWIMENMPDAELRLRQRAIFFQRLFRAATALLILAFIAATSFAFIAVKERNLAQAAKERADQNALKLEKALGELRGALDEAERLRAEANLKSEDSEKARREALEERRIAEEQSIVAREQKQQADEQRREADEARRRADDNASQLSWALAEADQQRELAEIAGAKSNAEAIRGRYAEYAANMNLAQYAWEAGNLQRLQELLDEQRPDPSQSEDLRGFEWFYLKRLAHSEFLTTALAESIADGREWRPAQSEVLKLEGHTNYVTSFDFSPDGRYIITGSHDNTARIWDAATGTVIRELEGHADSIHEVIFSPDGTRIATASADKTARIWDAATGEALLKMEGHTEKVNDVVFSGDGRRIATGSQDGTARVWDAATGKQVSQFPGHCANLLSVAFSPDGKSVVSSGEDNTTRLWDAESGTETEWGKDAASVEKVARLKDYTERVGIVVFSPDGKRIATGAEDKTARIWDAATGVELSTLGGHKDYVFNVAFSTDGKFLVTSSGDQTPKIWHVETGEVRTLEGAALRASVATFTPQGKFVAINVGNNPESPEVSYVSAGREAVSLRGHTDGVYNVAYSPDGKFIATGSADNTARVWDAATGRERRELRGHSDLIFSVAFSPDSRYLATGSKDKTARVWDLATGREVAMLKGHSATVLSVAFSPDGRHLVTACACGKAIVWEAESAREILTLSRHDNAINIVAYSPDGRRILTGSADETAKVWDAASGDELLTLEGHTSSIVGMAFSPDGQRIVTGSTDRTGRVWDAANGKELYRLKGHAAAVFRVTFSPDGRRIVTSSADKTAKLWDAASGHETLTLRGHFGGVNSVAFSPDGRRIVTGSDDQTARIWDAAAAEEIVALESRAP